MLNAKHKQALNLLRENKVPVDGIARTCGFSPEYLKDLMEGKPNTGPAGVLFSTEYKKVKRDISLRTRDNIDTLKERLVEDLLAWNEAINLQANGMPEMLTMSQVPEKRRILGELNKATAGIEIEEFHYHGLSGEDLINEFKRVKSLVQLTAGRPRVPVSIAKRSRGIPGTPKKPVSGTEEE